ncbi:MAG: hypothetical protein CVU11_14570 [Bacteroidetes bacterium HGW-Bacteroidetes-6]|nr:MAG: hypothetical protein CVU11_14570 [Bacteroidetes bacterium HGW-Bacteroidetes-6]
MSFVNDIKIIFGIESSTSLKTEEKFSSFKTNGIVGNFENINETSIQNLVSKISTSDEYLLSIQFDEENFVQLSSQKNSIPDFIIELNRKSKHVEEELIEFEFEIQKKIYNGQKAIYSIHHFLEFFNNISAIKLLSILHDELENSGFINYICIEECSEPFITANFSFDSKANIFNAPSYSKPQIKENCSFENYLDYPFDPNCFHIDTKLSCSNKTTNRFMFLEQLFSICGIFDATSFKENTFHFRLNGFKTHEGILDLNTNSVSLGPYFEIFNWIYSSDGNISDKIGIARNIISIFLISGKINIPDETFLSIKSGFNTYLKESVSKYIELRGKILDELSWISQKSSEIVEKYLTNYQRSLISFLTFFISIFILRVMNSEDYLGVFDKDATIFSFAFLAISVMYLIFSAWTLNLEKNRLKRKYSNIKRRYEDLLIEADISNILRDDEEFNYEMGFIAKRSRLYSCLWLITVLILAFSVMLISSYLSFFAIFE